MAVNQYWGIIPFGSTDSSVIMQCSCTSLAAVTAVSGGAEVTTGSNSYDSTLGVKPTATNGGVKFVSVSGYAALDYAGQASMEVETAAISVISATAPSSGANWAANTIFFTLRPVAGATTPANLFRWYQDANERVQVGQTIGTTAGVGTSPGSVNLEISSSGKARFCTVTFSWLGNQYDMYVNGMLVFSGARGGIPTTNIAERIDFMSGANTTFGAPVGYYGRNLIVSNRPVMKTVNNGVNKIGIIGHSFATRFKSTNTAALQTDTWRDSTGGHAMQAAFLASGFGAGFPADYSTVQDTPGAEIRHAATTHISAKIPAAVAQNCNVYVYLGGTNDVIQGTVASPGWPTNRATVLTDLKSDITDLMAATNARLLVLHNVTTLSANASQASFEPYVAQINADMATIPSWWNSTNPSRAGQVVVVDAYSAFGGASPPTNLFQGSLLGTYADAHPSSYGIMLMGALTAQAIQSAMR